MKGKSPSMEATTPQTPRAARRSADRIGSRAMAVEQMDFCSAQVPGDSCPCLLSRCRGFFSGRRSLLPGARLLHSGLSCCHPQVPSARCLRLRTRAVRYSNRCTTSWLTLQPAGGAAWIRKVQPRAEPGTGCAIQAAPLPSATAEPAVGLRPRSTALAGIPEPGAAVFCEAEGPSRSHQCRHGTSGGGWGGHDPDGAHGGKRRRPASAGSRGGRVLDVPGRWVDYSMTCSITLDLRWNCAACIQTRVPWELAGRRLRRRA